MRSSRPHVEPCLRRREADAVSLFAGDMVAAEPPGPDLGGELPDYWLGCVQVVKEHRERMALRT